MRRQWKWMGIAFAVMVLGGLLGRARIWPHPLEGGVAPDFTAPRLGGGKTQLSHESAPVLVLEFWANWCTPFLVALPRLEQVHQWAQRNNHPVSVYCINIGDSAADINKIWHEKNLNMPVLMDPQRHVADTYEVRALPQTVLIADGIVKHVYVGSRSVHSASLRQEIESSLTAYANKKTD